MNQSAFRKTVLALAVSMASAHALAQQVAIDDANPLLSEFQSLQQAVITGSYTGDQAGIYAEGTEFVDSLASEANIDTAGQHAVRLGNIFITANRDFAGVPERSGQLVNRGVVKATGVDAQAFYMNASATQGNLINEGEIRVIGLPGVEGVGAGALVINQTTVGGEIINTGTIAAEGAYSRGLYVKDSSILMNEIVNAGTISASGEESTALEMVGTNFHGKLINDGQIRADGVNASGVRIGAGNTLFNVDNAGDILATGENSVGVHIDGSTYVEDMVNTGNISGDLAGVWVESYQRNPNAVNALDPFMIVHESGTISGAQSAILVAEGVQADLAWFDAVIRGNLTNLARISVEGDAQFIGQRIEALNGGLNIESDASLDLSEASTLIQGDLYLSSGAVITATFAPERLQDGSIIMVDGKATLASESIIAIRSTEADFAEGGRTFSVIRAGELVDEGVTILGGTEMFDFVKNVAADNTITITATRKAQEELEDIIEVGTGNTNSQKAGAEFFEVAESLAVSNPNDPVFQALVAATDAQTLAKLAKQLAPDMTGSATHSASGGVTMVTNATSNRISAARSGMSSGYDMAGTGLWIEALGSDAEQEMRDNIDGFDADSRGFILGADVKLDDFITLGAYYSHIDTDTTTDAGNKNDATTHLLGLYGSYQVGTAYLDGNISAGRGNNDSKRFIAGTTAEADFDSSILSASVMTGKSYQPKEGVFIEPRAAVRYSNVKTDSYSETGSSAALTMGEQRIETGEVGAGVRLSTQLALHGGTLEPELSAMAYRDLIRDSAQGSAAYVLGGNTFTVTGATNDRATYEATLGAKYRRDNTTVGLSYNRMERSSFSADGFALKLRYDF